MLISLSGSSNTSIHLPVVSRAPSTVVAGASVGDTYGVMMLMLLITPLPWSENCWSQYQLIDFDLSVPFLQMELNLVWRSVEL